ncbi:hypothetical protein DL766_002378 [Monosporascus sp. MC13-8B]|nr:hypothetical protein DL766_002378 [Monosporascus sp. MC13-8B]
MTGLSLLDALLRSSLRLSPLTCPIASGVPVRYQDGRPRSRSTGGGGRSTTGSSTRIRQPLGPPGRRRAVVRLHNGGQLRAIGRGALDAPRGPRSPRPPWRLGQRAGSPGPLDLHRLDNGSYLMNYSAQLAADPARHCGTATGTGATSCTRRTGTAWAAAGRAATRRITSLLVHRGSGFGV